MTVIGIPALLAVSGYGAMTVIDLLKAQAALTAAVMNLQAMQTQERADRLDQTHDILHLIERLEDRVNGRTIPKSAP